MERARYEAQGRPDAEESPRIIDLGDVRRRRRSQGRGLPDPHRLLGMAVVALFGWALWAVVLLTIPPSRLLTYLAFFCPLWVALAATCSAILYVGQYRMGLITDAALCARRGMLIADAVIVNLALLAAHRWSVPAFIGIGAVACAVEFLRQRRGA